MEKQQKPALSKETKELLDERLLKLSTITKRFTWEEIKKNARQVRIEKGIEEADNGNLKPWKEV